MNKPNYTKPERPKPAPRIIKDDEPLLHFLIMLFLVFLYFSMGFIVGYNKGNETKHEIVCKESK